MADVVAGSPTNDLWPSKMLLRELEYDKSKLLVEQDTLVCEKWKQEIDLLINEEKLHRESQNVAKLRQTRQQNQRVLQKKVQSLETKLGEANYLVQQGKESFQDFKEKNEVEKKEMKQRLTLEAEEKNVKEQEQFNREREGLYKEIEKLKEFEDLRSEEEEKVKKNNEKNTRQREKIIQQLQTWKEKHEKSSQHLAAEITKRNVPMMEKTTQTKMESKAVLAIVKYADAETSVGHEQQGKDSETETLENHILRDVVTEKRNGEDKENDTRKSKKTKQRMNKKIKKNKEKVQLCRESDSDKERANTEPTKAKQCKTTRKAGRKGGRKQDEKNKDVQVRVFIQAREDTTDDDVFYGIPAKIQENVPTEIQESVPTEKQKSVLTEVQESVPTEKQKSVPTEVQESVPTKVQESVPTEKQKSVLTEVQESVPTEVQESVLTEVQESVPIEVQANVPTEVQGNVPTEVQGDVSTEVQESVPTEVQENILTEVQKDVPTEVQENNPNEVQNDIPMEVQENVLAEIQVLDVCSGTEKTVVESSTCNDVLTMTARKLRKRKSDELLPATENETRVVAARDPKKTKCSLNATVEKPHVSSVATSNQRKAVPNKTKQNEKAPNSGQCKVKQVPNKVKRGKTTTQQNHNRGKAKNIEECPPNPSASVLDKTSQFNGTKRRRPLYNSRNSTLMVSFLPVQESFSNSTISRGKKGNATCMSASLSAFMRSFVAPKLKATSLS